MEKYKIEIDHKLIQENNKIVDNHLHIRFLKKAEGYVSDFYRSEASFIISTDEVKPFLETLSKSIDDKLNEIENYGKQGTQNIN